jgi:MoaA/NifB/PqqE/SkfB family radical SAM enzyme
MKFDFKKHILYRSERMQHIRLDNKNLLGLATVEINPTELCNRTCSFCPRHDPQIYPNRNLNMTVGTAAKLCEQLLDSGYNGDINITGFGEPLLNKDIIKICNIFSKHFHTELITNGDSILNNKISIDNFEELSLLIIDCYDGDNQIESFNTMLKDSKVNYMLRNHYDSNNKDLISTYGFNNRGGAMYNAELSNKPCFLPSYKAFIDWNGDVRLCCNDWFRLQDSFGNVNSESFSDIWMSQKFTKVRVDLINGLRNKYKPCQNCDVNGTLVGQGSANLWR